MLYQLPGGGTIRIDEDIFFKMTDEQFDKFISNLKGSEIIDPFYDSSLDSKDLESDNDLMDDPSDFILPEE